MQTTAQVVQYVHSIVAFTGNSTEQGPERRTSVPAQFQRNFNGVKDKTEALKEYPVVTKGTEGNLNPESYEWLRGGKDFKLPEDKLHVGNNDKNGQFVAAFRFIDGDLELTNGEKQFVKWCASTRDEVPAVDDATLDGYEELVK